MAIDHVGEFLIRHHGEPDAPTLPLAKPLIALGNAGFRAIFAAKPDRALANEVADHDPILVTLADRDLVDADHHRPRAPALASWARMYCLSSSFTVCQSSLNSSAISRIGALRQRRPT